MKIIKEELQFEESLKQRINFICEFAKVKPTFINGSIRKIERTNIAYIEPHRVIVKNTTFLVFNYSNDVYINNLTKKIKLSELENYIKCKINIKEEMIDKYFNSFMDEIVEYDSIVNQFFLPIIKQKFDEPKEKLEKEIKAQQMKLDRIKRAYVNGAFTLDEYKEERKNAEKLLDNLESELNDTNCSEEITFTPKDILLKRDIDYINKVQLKEEYDNRTKKWSNYSREEQADIVMRYIDSIELNLIGSVITLKSINFRQSVYRPYQDLVDNGYMDMSRPVLFGNVLGRIRFSNYLPEDEVAEIIMRLRQYYDVGYGEATYFVNDEAFYFDTTIDNSAIVRVFPLKDYNKIDPEKNMPTYTYGIIYIREENKFKMEDISTAFDYIPDDKNDSVLYMKNPEPIKVEVKPVVYEQKDISTQKR